ncbi:MAG: hypothetical protein ACI309_01620, partial [Candidatus Limisoma sp.]
STASFICASDKTGVKMKTVSYLFISILNLLLKFCGAKVQTFEHLRKPYPPITRAQRRKQWLIFVKVWVCDTAAPSDAPYGTL